MPSRAHQLNFVSVGWISPWGEIDSVRKTIRTADRVDPAGVCGPHHRTDHIKMADLIGAARRKAGTLSQIGIRIGIRKTRSFYEGIRPNIGVPERISLTSAELNSHGGE